MSSIRSSASKERGFTLLELLVAMTVMGVLLVIVLTAFTSGLRVKNQEDMRLELQQNLRGATQLMAEDLRSSAFLHLWQTLPASSCATAGTPCSNHTMISIVTLDGTRTAIPEPPGSSFANSAETLVCDARDFHAGQLALLYNGGQVDLLPITLTQETRNYNKACAGPANPPVNADRIQHNTNKISGQWSSAAFMFKAAIATYELRPDPLYAGRTVLYRYTGLNGKGPGSGIVAFDISGLKIEYGVPINPTARSSQLRFYDSPSAAVAASGSGYTEDPAGGGGTYIGSVARAVRITLTGTTLHNLPGTPNPATYTVNQTVEFRR